MSKATLKKLENFKKKFKLTDTALASNLGFRRENLIRWRKSGHISPIYDKYIKEFLDTQTLPKLSSPSVTNHKPTDSDIAVIGISCFYPGAAGIKELWENILARRIQFRRILDQRLPLNEYYNADPSVADKTYLTRSSVIENFTFDWNKRRIPKRTYDSTDIAHWLALEIAIKTFEDAGFKITELPLENTGVIVGNTLTGEQTRSQTLRYRWPYAQKVFYKSLLNSGYDPKDIPRILEETEEIFKAPFAPITEDSLSGGLANTIAGRICNYLNLKGGGYIVDGACSSSLLAVATAANALKMRDLDLALAGGVDISLDPFELIGFSKAGALTKELMRVYDRRAGGFIPGEGCGFVLLKRLEDAIRDKNYVYALIKGWGISSDGRGGIMEPSATGQAYAINRAYKHLDYKPCDVDFIEGHGTGTAKGDRVELEGIAAAVSGSLKSSKNKRFCGVTSFKSIVGHTKAAAGVGGLIKAVLAVNQRILPPTANCQQPNDVFGNEAKNLYPIIQGNILPLAKKMKAGVSSAGFGGINCHIALQSYGKPAEKLKTAISGQALLVSNQETEVFTFSAPSLTRIGHFIKKFREEIRFISIAEMADLAALLNKKYSLRSHTIKIAVVADLPENLYEALLLIEKELQNLDVAPGEIKYINTKNPKTHIVLSNSVKNKKIGFLYPGQGSQQINMSRRLMNRFSWAEDCLKFSSLPLKDYIYKSTSQFITKEDRDISEHALRQTEITQPAVVFSSLIWTKYLHEAGILPTVTCGHSLGELTAFYTSGVLNEKGLMNFAQRRGAVMAATGSKKEGTMLSLFCPLKRASSLIKQIGGSLVIANINSPTQIIASGSKKDIAALASLAKKEHVSTLELNVSNAFHSPFMSKASLKISKDTTLPKTKSLNQVKLISSVSGGLIKKEVDAREYFSKQIVSSVNFVKAVDSLSKNCDLIIEVGPGRVLSDLVKSINKDLVCLPVESNPENDRDFNIVLSETFVRGVPVKWEAVYRNRLIKTFVPPSKKKFIENPCERPVRLNNQILDSAPSQLNLPEISLPQSVTSFEPQITKEPISTSLEKNKIADLLIDITTKMSGFDRQSISLDMKLLDDLNLDSIKAAEVIASAAKLTGMAGKIDPSQFSNRSLGQICEHLYELSQSGPASAVSLLENILKADNSPALVRDFSIKFREEEIVTHYANQLKDIKTVVVISDKSDQFPNSFRQHFNKKSTTIHHFSISDLTSGKAKKLKNIDCLIFSLPRNSQNINFNKRELKSLMDQIHSVLHLATSTSLQLNAFVLLVQFGGGDFGESGNFPAIATSCLKSIGSTLSLERPELKIRIVDFVNNISPELLSIKLHDELQTNEQFNSVGFNKDLKRLVAYYEVTKPSEYKKRNIKWTENDVVLVSGGAKGITAECALEFAKSTKAKLVLLGRSAKPKADDINNEIRQTLNRFRKENLFCEYFQCDIVDDSDVSQAIETIEKRLGKITGFIHGAGLNSLSRLKQSDPKVAYNEALPKIVGAINICNALAKNPLKLIVGLTSIIGLTGMEGSGWYGFANELLNLYLTDYRKKNSPQNVLTVAYSIWDEIGMGARLGSINKLSDKGIRAIPIKDGVKHFRKLVEFNPGCQQVIVSSRIAGVHTWKNSVYPTNNFRFIEEIEYFIPGVELITKVHLNIEDDSYLLDHNWKGSLLFPFVFGLEAMVQAAAYVTNTLNIDRLDVSNIVLEKPIPVSKEAGALILIHAQSLESNEEYNKVSVTIYSEQTAFKEPHFTAFLKLFNQNMPENGIHPAGPQIKPSLGVSPAIDLYGPILFQGKLFQCIENLYELCFDEKKQEGTCEVSLLYQVSSNNFLKVSPKFNNFFITRDPFCIDASLQSMQIIIPQDISLPNKIEKIELAWPPGDNCATIHSRSAIKRLDASHYMGSSETISQGLNLKVSGCLLKVLDKLPQNPSANDLNNPAFSVQKFIETNLSDLSKECAFSPPFVRCIFDKALVNAKKKDRHSIEIPVIKSAVEGYWSREKIPNTPFNIEWDNLGKPLLKGVGVAEAGISISHNDDFLIVIVGNGNQGCDIETVVKRSKEDWFALMGEPKSGFINKLHLAGLNWDEAGTIIWSVIETFNKIVGEDTIISIDFIIKNNFIFSIINYSQAGATLVTVSFSLDNKRGAFLTLIINSSNLKYIINPQVPPGESLFNKLGYEVKTFSINLDYSGPQKQLVYSQRLPVTFKNNQQLSRRVYFTSYFDWIGLMREYSLRPIIGKITALTETGGWGLATNHVITRIWDDLRADDVVEIRCWIERVVGEEGATFDTSFEWNKVLANGGLSKVAYGELRSTWIQITGHGEAKVGELPIFLKDFIVNMSPAQADPKFTSLESTKIQQANFFLGNKDDNFKTKIFLTEQSFQTTLEDSNLVGNVYFTNYSKWLGRTRDLFFFSLMPNYYSDLGKKGEFFTLSCDLFHLREAMPFDKVIVKMFLVSLYENGLDLYFEFYLYENGRVGKKLAYGNQSISWSTRDRNQVIKTVKLPDKLLAKLTLLNSNSLVKSKT